MRQRRTLLGLTAAALVLAAGAHAGRAMAYFTDCVSASGSASVSLEFPDTEIEEEKGIWTKIVTVKNTGKCDCFIRVRAYAADGRTDENQWILGEGWIRGADGYYYYRHPLGGSESEDPGREKQTTSLEIKVTEPADGDTEDFNVIVVNEHTFVSYDADGNPDWRLSWGLPAADQEKGE